MRFVIPHIYLRCFLFVVIALSFSIVEVSAQDNGASAPEVTIDQLETRLRAVETNPDLSEDEKNLIGALTTTAIEAIRGGNLQQEKMLQLEQELQNSPRTIDGLKAEIKRAQSAPIKEQNSDQMTGEDLLQLERDLITIEGEMRTFRAEAARYENALQSLTQQSVREDLVATRQAVADVTADLVELEDSDLGPLRAARRASQSSRQYLLRNTIKALEQEVAGEPARQQILALRHDLAELNAERADLEVIALQTVTGQRRVKEARKIYDDAMASMGILEKSHPLVQGYAAENYQIGKQLREIAETASVYPRLQATSRSRLDDVKSDLKDAQELTKLGEINRQSSATLRRLRDQQISVKMVRANMGSNQKQLLTATQNRLWAQQRIRSMPIGQFDASQIVTDWMANNPGYPVLSSSDLLELNALYLARRDLLQEMSDAAFYEETESNNLARVQTQLLETAMNLSAILEKNLLWLPSVKAIDGEWPQRFWRGTFDVFNLNNLTRSSDVITRQLFRFWFPALLFLSMSVLLYVNRRRFRKSIIEDSALVGRVQKDTYWVTPRAFLYCALIAAPIPIMLFFLGVMFKSSTAPDNFIESLGQTGIELSGYFWFFLMWREWNKEKSLFAAHFKTPSLVRKNVLIQLRWFIPTVGVFIALVTLTQNSREPDVYEGFSLLAFIITALAFAWFGYRMLWFNKGQLTRAFSEQNYFRRYHHVLVLFGVSLPVLAAGLAAIGYYDTARELLSRLFFSGGLMVATYALYGLLRRTVLVAHRRLSLRNAIERREQAIKVREEQQAAEERGETLAPPVNYEEIDVETLSRQSVQLLNTFIGIGFAVLMWMFWQDLFPALSVFDKVQLWATEWEVIGGKKTPIAFVTLWNLVQSVAIVILTLILARNLPGLLEIFVLNRSRLDRGTRYAVVSIVGYVIVAIGFYWAFRKLGMDWSQFQWVAAALGVGIGFGLQEIIANFISGLIILFERPIRVGDYITIGGQSGTINRIQIRATTLSDLDNREIFIPNKELITQKVMNWTLTDTIVRMIIPVGIAYGSDTEKAREIMLKVINSNDRVLEKPKSNVYFLGFGDSSLDFELRIFVRSVDDRFGVSHELHTEINRELAAAGFEIPFPQRDLHIISQPETKL